MKILLAALISRGRYENAGEVIRAGLRLLEDEENKIKSLQQAIREGVESGIAFDFTPQKHFKLLKAGMRKMVTLFFDK